MSRPKREDRTLCLKCLQSDFSCYCSVIRRFDPKIKFIILIHPIERKRRIATGRMSSLCLEGSELIEGEDYSENQRVNELVHDPNYHPVVLYPGAKSIDLNLLSESGKSELFPHRKLLVFVVDGTWATARKMMRKSVNLNSLPRICFTPSAPSRFLVRKQPKPGCYSTIEAIYETIELVGRARGFDVDSRAHDNLLQVFGHLVNKQLLKIPGRAHLHFVENRP